MRTRERFGCLILAAAVLLTGCTSGSAPNTPGSSSTPEPKDSTMQARKLSDVQQQVKSFAEEIAAEVGHPLEHWSTQPAPCESAKGGASVNGPWTLTGFANIAVRPEDQVATLTRLRDRWQGAGYLITEFRTIPPGNRQGTLSARVPAGDLTVTLESTAPGTALSVLVATGCYAPAPGETPGN